MEHRFLDFVLQTKVLMSQVYSVNILELTEYAPEALYCDNPGHNEPAQDKYNGGPGLFNESQS